MCVLQDFEALTPNLLARTIETVEGGWRRDPSRRIFSSILSAAQCWFGQSPS